MMKMHITNCQVQSANKEEPSDLVECLFKKNNVDDHGKKNSLKVNPANKSTQREMVGIQQSSCFKRGRCWSKIFYF